MADRTQFNRGPQIPVPSSLGGGMMTMFVCRGQMPGDCTAPNCTSKPVTKCRFPLFTRDGAAKTCGRALCGKHATNGLCPAHAKLVQARPNLLP